MKYFWMYIKQTLRFVLKPMSFVPAIVMMCLIYGFSAQPGEDSGGLSYLVGVKLFEVIDKLRNKGWSAAQIADFSSNYQFYIRKAAHITEYFLLAVSVAFPLYVYRVRGIWLVLIAGFICVGYAALDEYHQSFIAGRGPSKRDVAIDSIGIFAGIILTRIVGWTGRMTIFRPLSNKKSKDKSAKSRKA